MNSRRKKTTLTPQELADVLTHLRAGAMVLCKDGMQPGNLWKARRRISEAISRLSESMMHADYYRRTANQRRG